MKMTACISVLEECYTVQLFRAKWSYMHHRGGMQSNSAREDQGDKRENKDTRQQIKHSESDRKPQVRDRPEAEHYNGTAWSCPVSVVTFSICSGMDPANRATAEQILVLRAE